MPEIFNYKLKFPSKKSLAAFMAVLEIGFCVLFISSSVNAANSSNNPSEYVECKAIPEDINSPDYIQTPDSNPLMKELNSEVTLTVNHNLLGAAPVTDVVKESVSSAVYSQNTKKDSPKIEEKLLYKFPIGWGDRSKAELCLTFDDGYDAKAIEKTLDVLGKAGIKSTFFVVGTQLKAHQDLWKRAVSEGHLICNHTNNHVFLSKLTDEQIKKEILGWEQAVDDTLGKDYLQKMKKEFPFLRMPGGDGCRSNRVLKDVKDLGYTNIWWSDETCNSVLGHLNLKKNTIDSIALKVSNHVINNASNGSIILLHFNEFDTADLYDIINGISKKGLSFKQLNEILK